MNRTTKSHPLIVTVILVELVHFLSFYRMLDEFFTLNTSMQNGIPFKNLFILFGSSGLCIKIYIKCKMKWTFRSLALTANVATLDSIHIVPQGTESLQHSISKWKSVQLQSEMQMPRKSYLQVLFLTLPKGKAIFLFHSFALNFHFVDWSVLYYCSAVHGVHYIYIFMHINIPIESLMRFYRFHNS